MQTTNISKLKDDELKIFLASNKIGLSTDEARKIIKILGRDPSITELVIWANQGSEHASYKSTKSFLKTLPISGPNVILGPSEDSGIIKLCDLPDGDAYGIVVSHESHNSPSQVVPYEGAATGVGGIMRDIICMGSRAIGILDSLRFGNLENERSRLIANGCVEGVAGYGNPIGVPNLGGNVYFDENFKNMCLVNVFALGLIKSSQLIHSYAPQEAENEKYEYILVGKATDNSGFGGAAFSSKILDETKTDENRGAVQEPNPFLERHIMASSYDLFKILEKEGKLDKVGFKDLGAGGIVCASVELVDRQGLGAEIDLDKVHVGMDNLPPQVIACSETQERFMWIVHHSLTEMILKHYNEKWDFPNVSQGAKASCIGYATKGGKYRIKYNGEYICDAEAKDITEGIIYDRPFKKPERKFEEVMISKIDLNKSFTSLISSTNIASNECIYEKYDKNVQGNSIIERSESDASVIRPLTDENIVIADESIVIPDPIRNLENENINNFGSGLNSKGIKNIGVSLYQGGSGRYGLISPYEQGTNAVARSCLVIASTGSVPQCITDCLNYGNPEIPEQMWEFVDGLNGIKDACTKIKLKGTDNPLPIVSGNVSLYKDVPPSAIIGCVGIISDYRKAITQKLKKNGSVLILIGKRKNELGGSEFYRGYAKTQLTASLQNHTDKHGQVLGANVPKTNFEEIQKITYLLPELIQEGKILSTKTILEGGMICAINQMIMPNQKNKEYKIGAEIDISYSKLEDYQELFSETLGVIIEVEKEHEKDVIEKFGDIAQVIGETTANPSLVVKSENEALIDLSNKEMFEIWNTGLRNEWS